MNTTHMTANQLRVKLLTLSYLDDEDLELVLEDFKLSKEMIDKRIVELLKNGEKIRAMKLYRVANNTSIAKTHQAITELSKLIPSNRIMV